MKKELASFTEYLLSNSSEEAKRPLVYPYFKKLFGSDFKIESDAENSDGYIEGKLLVELKTSDQSWLQGLYQGLHYQKLGLSFPNITVIAKQFISLWKVSDLPAKVLEIANNSDSQISPSATGKINSNKTSKLLATRILNSYTFRLIKEDFSGLYAKDIEAEILSYTHALKYLDKARVQINLRNFIDHIDVLQKFFDKPFDAIHAFFAIVGYWSGASIANQIGERNAVIVIDPTRSVSSEPVEIDERNIEPFTKFVETHYVFTNEGSGITYDNYFSRFDEVISRLDPAYTKQHGIFFTDHNLSKFAMWFVHQRFEKNLSENYIVFDPAGGSGNLITSLDWRGHLKHKIVSELQPDLLKVIERRMRVHEKHVGKYTIIPKTKDNKGLNFLDKSGDEYLAELNSVLKEKGLSIDKPLAFLLNPPYKNTDEDVAAREQVDAEYTIDDSILELTGTDAGRERYLAFLGQLFNIAKKQYETDGYAPIIMIFTPTSWLIPRPTYVPFRKEFDKHFKYENGFLITSNEFFEVPGKWPLAFTIWSHNYIETGNKNRTRLWDYTYLKREDLACINWSARIHVINKSIKQHLYEAKQVNLDNSRREIRDKLPYLECKGNKRIPQPRYNIYRNLTEEDQNQTIVSGFPFRDSRHQRIKAPHGFVDGNYVGFMDDLTPVRLRLDTCNRLSNDPDRLWFYLDNRVIKLNLSKIFAGPADNRSYCAYDLESAKVCLSWYAITKAINGRYPTWVNQYNVWQPKIRKGLGKYYFSLCFAFGLAENRCVVMKFEANNPVDKAPEIYVDNPMSTNNPDSFWKTTLDDQIVKRPAAAYKLVLSIKDLYNDWATNHCKTGIMTRVGLQNEPYFKYFDYNDFLTPNSGLIQIRKYADVNNKADLQEQLEVISRNTKVVRDEIFRLLIKDFKYFE